MMQYIKDNLNAVRAELADAMQAAPKDSCRILAAVKYAAPGEIEALLDAGVRDVGENRVQQLLDNAPIYAAHDVRVHFIGTLQTNKVKYIADKVDMIHSLDSERLAREIEKRAAACGRVIDVLVEINVAREQAKTGVLPEDAEALCRAVLALPHLRLCGFMTMGPIFDSEDAYRAYFKKTVTLGSTLWHALDLAGKPLFSMGMSQSYIPAVKEGADFVRVGRLLFAGRPAPEAED